MLVLFFVINFTLFICSKESKEKYTGFHFTASHILVYYCVCDKILSLLFIFLLIFLVRLPVACSNQSGSVYVSLL